MRWNTHEDFQTYPPVRGSARNCLMWNKRVTTASCAGVRWNDQECAGVGHNLGTNRSAAYWITSSARCSSDAAIVGSSAFALFEMCVTPNLSNAPMLSGQKCSTDRRRM